MGRKKIYQMKTTNTLALLLFSTAMAGKLQQKGQMKGVRLMKIKNAGYDNLADCIWHNDEYPQAMKMCEIFYDGYDNLTHCLNNTNDVKVWKVACFDHYVDLDKLDNGLIGDCLGDHSQIDCRLGCYEENLCAGSECWD